MLSSCQAQDDGELELPASMVSDYTGEVSLQLRRTATRYTEVQLLDGTPMHVYLKGCHARLGRITFEQ